MKLLQKLLKRFVQLCLLVPVLLILKFNWTLYFSPTCEQKINLDVLNQLNHLEKAIKKDEVDFKMQNLFPEGYFFTNVLYGLAWADLIETVDKENPVFQRGILEIEYSIAKLNSEVGPAASVVAIKAMAENRDYGLYIPIRNTIEAFGFSVEMFEEKYYLGNQLPVADAFIAWCNAKNCRYESVKEGWWRWQFQLICFLIVVLFGWWIYRL